jgi:AraC-like DNA-binding protein
MVLPDTSRYCVIAIRVGYERLIEMYVLQCFRARTPARVSELADLLGNCRPAVSRLICQLFGRPLGKILRARQFQYATFLLETTPLEILKVAQVTGFGDPSTFFRSFRNEYGMTPAAYRANATKCN